MEHLKPPRMRSQLDAALRNADHLGPADKGAIALARALADAIDASYAAGDLAAYRKFTTYASPMLLNAMRALALTPDGRKKAGLPVTDRKEPDPLAELRAKRRAR